MACSAAPSATNTPGESTEFTYYVIGPRDAPEKVHLQAALHADEQPGTMVLHRHAAARDRAAQAGVSFAFNPTPLTLGHGNHLLTATSGGGATDVDGSVVVGASSTGPVDEFGDPIVHAFAYDLAAEEPTCRAICWGR